MIQEKKLLSDIRVKIDEEAHINVFRRPIIYYRIIDIPVGKIRRVKEGKIISLKDSCVYKWLSGECSEEEYLEYCNNNNYDKRDRSPQLFSQVINEVKSFGYKLEYGAIVIDQYNCIIDGLHRSSYLLSTFGEDYIIPVVKIYYLYRTPRGFLLNLIYNYEKKWKKHI